MFPLFFASQFFLSFLGQYNFDREIRKHQKWRVRSIWAQESLPFQFVSIQNKQKKNHFERKRAMDAIKLPDFYPSIIFFLFSKNHGITASFTEKFFGYWYFGDANGIQKFWYTVWSTWYPYRWLHLYTLCSYFSKLHFNKPKIKYKKKHSCNEMFNMNWLPSLLG